MATGTPAAICFVAFVSVPFRGFKPRTFRKALELDREKGAHTESLHVSYTLAVCGVKPPRETSA